MSEIRLKTPLSEEQLIGLKCGDRVLITGTIYAARDAAHMKMMEELGQGSELPFPIQGSVIYYAGPTPTRPGNISGAFGPTTSGRMDKMTVPLLERGLKGMIGKGMRSQEVVDSIIDNKAVYFAAIGGAGALIARSVLGITTVAYEDLGAEAIRKVEVEDFPAIVAIDTKGKCIYDRDEL